MELPPCTPTPGPAAAHRPVGSALAAVRVPRNLAASRPSTVLTLASLSSPSDAAAQSQRWDRLLAGDDNDPRPTMPMDPRLAAAARDRDEAAPVEAANQIAGEAANTAMLGRIAALFQKKTVTDEEEARDLAIPRNAPETAAAVVALSRADKVSSPFTKMKLPAFGNIVTMVTVEGRCKAIAKHLRQHTQALADRRKRRIAASNRAEARRRWRLIRSVARGKVGLRNLGARCTGVNFAQCAQLP